MTQIKVEYLLSHKIHTFQILCYILLYSLIFTDVVALISATAVKQITHMYDQTYKSWCHARSGLKISIRVAEQLWNLCHCATVRLPFLFLLKRMSTTENWCGQLMFRTEFIVTVLVTARLFIPCR